MADRQWNSWLGDGIHEAGDEEFNVWMGYGISEDQADVVGGRIMGSLAGLGGLAGHGGMAGKGGGIAG